MLTRFRYALWRAWREVDYILLQLDYAIFGDRDTLFTRFRWWLRGVVEG